MASDAGASPCDVTAEGTGATPCPFLSSGVDGGGKNAGKAVQENTGAGATATEVVGKERAGEGVWHQPRHHPMPRTCLTPSPVLCICVST